MIPIGSRNPFDPQRPLARLQVVLADETRSLRVGWFGLVCGGTPTITLALTEAGLSRSDLRVGQPLVLTIPLEVGGRKVTEVSFQGRLVEVRDWHGKLLLKAQLTEADGGGCRLVGRSLNRLCQVGGWKQLFLPSAHPA
ncbi:hypothetical protein [Geothermobacter hydrogeniphilus]|uniref:PilZ domain-containing protein n=1 Tax=Geothermobacter hydrogeniphilus TaxID=1969733 RepID=A0A1X0Y3P4_9BACT|nr:hypothetical protein [Geothermobacter hydrogeniphilus]ORJ59786.1 hypothetical protein B5V00_08915 [Geothermobacter hydrogeniphilus]